MNAGELALRLASEAPAIAAYLLPNGKRAGNEWKAGSVAGEAGQSLSVRLTGAKAGVWKDFSSGEGGDLLDLWAAVRSQSMAEALTDVKAYLGVRDAKPLREEKAYKRPAKPKCHQPQAKALEWLQGRGLELRTLEAFKIGEYDRDGKTYAVFPYLRDGELVNAKHRNVADKRDMRQEGGAEPCLFGWHLIDPKARVVAIAEGEIDAMSLHQCGVPALSVNAGAGNHQWIESDWDRLERFSDILIFFDSDEAGEKGAAEVIRRLGVERCKRVTIPAKDANEWLQQGATSEDFRHAIDNAKPMDPDEMRSLSDFMGRVKAMFYPAHDAEHDPFLRLDQSFDWFEFRPGELTVWTGYNGHGKSQLLSQVQLGLMAQGERVMIFSGELTPARQLARMSKQAAGLDRPSRQYLDAIEAWLRDKAWVFNQVGSATIARLLEVFQYANKRYGVRHFVIDSLMMTDVPEDGTGAMSAQKKAIQTLADFAKRNGCHVHLVAHPRKGRDENTGPGKLDVAGSSKITDGADNVFTVWAALRDESEPVTDESDARLELRKQRNGEIQHFTLKLWFLKGCGQYVSNSRRRAVSYVEFSSHNAEQEAA